MEILEMIREYIKPELLILVPVLYLIGAGIKLSQMGDKFIPIILGGIGIVLSLLYLSASGLQSGLSSAITILFSSITQGILVAGASVYINQLVKQNKPSVENEVNSEGGK